MKYITYVNSEGADDIRLFSIMEQHKDISVEMGMVSDVPIVLLGAGFVTFNDDGSIECYGHSDSMKLDSRGEQDTKILNINMRISRKR
jgi:hypothetical protein